MQELIRLKHLLPHICLTSYIQDILNTNSINFRHSTSTLKCWLISLPSPTSIDRPFEWLLRRILSSWYHSGSPRPHLPRSRWRPQSCCSSPAYGRSFVNYYFNKFKAVLSHVAKRDHKRATYKRPFSMDYREQRSHARGMYSTKDTPRMGTVRMKQEEEADTRIIVIE